ncbi:negative elongation factor B [Hydra vulgaris]|uniref:negative elongation factor B n=1 Tax=Hydra vulgaris TaxID=6087 RepID=UPI0001925A86|nr:negative elongation factor B [Hydra vulgaris]
MSGFEESGLAGKHSIRKGFKECREPEAFISTFQQENCVLLSSLHPALHLLDLQEVKRVVFHQSVISDLSEKLIKRINASDYNDQKLKELIDHTIQFIHVDALRPVIMTALKKLKEVKPETIELISLNEKIYNDCPIEVKRKVWMKKHPLFGDAVGPILNRYIIEKQSLIYSTENTKSQNFFSLSTRERRQKPIVKQLVEMIGTSIDLYNLVLQFLRTLFLRTKEENYCSLRSELLMAFHDADIKEIHQVDPCHKFTWCLDACIRDKSIDTRRLKELQTFLDTIKNGQEEVMGDIAMILCDPYATNTIIVSIMQVLNKLIAVDVLPRSSGDLMFLIRLLCLSLGAWDMIKAQNFKEESLNIDIVTKFLPLLMSIMMDCMGDESNENPNNIKVPDNLFKFIQESTPSQLIVCYYLNQVIQSDKVAILEVVLPQFAQVLKNQVISTYVFNLFVHRFACCEENFSRTRYLNLVFDQFLFVWLQNDDAFHHILRLLWFVYQKVDSQELVRLLTATQPLSKHTDVIHDLHARLVDIIASSKVNTPLSTGSNEHNNSISPVTSPNTLFQGITS